MAWIFGDSFDLYNAIGDLSIGHWDSQTASNWSLVSAVNTRFNAGQALQSGAFATVTLTKTSSTNDAGHHFVLAFRQAGTTSGTSTTAYITLGDGATAQCSICFQSDGAISLRSGGVSGTVLSTYSGVLSSLVWYAIEFEVVINNTTGSFKIRINGNASDDHSATGLNTRGGTSNNYANKVTLGNTGNINSTYQYDDFLWFSTSGAAPNTWVGDIRAVQQTPISDATIGLSPSPGLTNIAYVSVPSAGTNLTVAANTEYIGYGTNGRLLQPSYAGTIASLTVNIASAYTGKFKLALYAGTPGDSTGLPLALLATSVEQINASAGVNTLALATPYVTALLATSTYFTIGVLADSTIVLISNGGNCNYSTKSQAYTSGFTSNISGYTSNSGFNIAPMVSYNMTPFNSALTGEVISNADTSFVYGSTASVGDFYNLSSLSGTITSIIAVQTRMAARKSDTGTRTARIQIKSGATTSNGTTTNMSLSYTYLSKVDVTDPNTGSAWTSSNVNSLQIGPYVVA